MNPPKTMQVLTVTYIAPSQIKSRPGNPRRHPRRQIKQLVASMREFGFVSPVLVDEETVLIAGHGRLEAAQVAGLELVPVIQLGGLSEVQKRALMVADNKLTENAAWDPELLTTTLRELVDIQYDVELTGFDTGELDRLLHFTDGAGAADDADEEDEPDRNVPAVSRDGDTWILGDHGLYCGDGLQAPSYGAVLDGRKAQMIFTDPPYNVPIDGHVSGLGAVRHRNFVMASGEMSEAEFVEFLKVSTSLMTRFSEDGSLHFICMDWRHLYHLLTATRGIYAEQKNLCVWAKSNAGMGSLYRSRHELVAVFKNGQAPHINNVELGRHGRHRSNVWEYAGASSFGSTRQQDLEAHPTVKPVALIADAILDCSKPNGIVLDPFGGSGTTILACQRTKRRAAVIEIDPHYVDVAVHRFEKATRTTAIHAETGLSFEALRRSRFAAGGEGAP